MNTAAPMDIPRWKTVLNMMINPGEVVKNQMTKIPWFFQAEDGIRDKAT